MGKAKENPYLRDAVMTASPEQLQLMLYDGAIRYALQGRDAVERADWEEAYNKLTRAQQIVLEMQRGLNHEVNPKLCAQVAAVYGFVYHRLVDASVKREVQFVDDALKVLRVERDTWQMVVDKVTAARQAIGSPGMEPAASLPVAPPAGDEIPTISLEG
jgi:flagellar protein FliS